MTPASPTVFLGPSLPVADARRILDAVYRPPLCRGDLDGLPSPAAVLVIDGILDAGRRLPIDEARRAIGRGLVLYGAASTGAFLAAALDDCGMKGAGRVHALFRAGRIGLDDIAVLQSTDGHEPVTVPMVNVISWLDNLTVSGKLDPDRANAAVSELRATRIEERTTARVLEILGRHLGTLPSDGRTPPWPDLKAADARELLSQVALGVADRRHYPHHMNRRSFVRSV